MKRNTLIAAAIAGAIGLTVISCTLVYHDPPGAPAHGYVVVHQDAELVFDSGLGLYIVSGYPNYYFYRGYYYRVYDGGRYERCRSIKGSWRSVRPSGLPPGLAKKYAVRSHDDRDTGRGRGHGRGDDKRGHDS